MIILVRMNSLPQYPPHHDTSHHKGSLFYWKTLNPDLASGDLPDLISTQTVQGRMRGSASCCIPVTLSPTTKLKLTPNWRFEMGLVQSFTATGHRLTPALRWLGVRISGSGHFCKNIWQCRVTRPWLMLFCCNVSPPLPLCGSSQLPPRSDIKGH